MIFFDHNATNPIKPELFAVMPPFPTELRGKPGSRCGMEAQLKSIIGELHDTA